MVPNEAANYYLQLLVDDEFEAIAFARAYEDRASESEFDAYLRALDLQTA